MSYFCFNKECEYYKKPAPDQWKGGYMLLGCGCCTGHVGQTFCDGCGELRIEHDNYLTDERTEREKFSGTRKDVKQLVQEEYLEQKYGM